MKVQKGRLAIVVFMILDTIFALWGPKSTAPFASLTLIVPVLLGLWAAYKASRKGYGRWVLGSASGRSRFCALSRGSTATAAEPPLR